MERETVTEREKERDEGWEGKEVKRDSDRERKRGMKGGRERDGKRDSYRERKRGMKGGRERRERDRDWERKGGRGGKKWEEDR